MAQVYKFSKKEIEEIAQARRENKDKRAEARLKALEMRAKGAKGKEIAAATGFHPAYAAQLAAKYKKGGIEAISGNHYGGNRRNMSVEDEWGNTLPPERVLNRKQPLNFILPEPTLLRYIDPTLALHNHAALELILSEYLPGIRKADLKAEQEYWDVVEKNGMIAEELSAAGL